MSELWLVLTLFLVLGVALLVVPLVKSQPRKVTRYSRWRAARTHTRDDK